MTEDDRRFLEKGRELYEQGKKKSELLYCLAHCISNNVPIPPWLRQAFLIAYFAEVKSWDDVFGRKLKKGKQLETERSKSKKAFPIWDCISVRHAAGEPLEKLFREVGEEFGMGSTAAKELYYEMEEAHNSLPTNETEERIWKENWINRK